MSTPEKGSVWQHRKGGKYTVVGVAMDSDTGKDVVVYTDKNKQMWTRLLAEFMDGRFTEVGFVQRMMIDEEWLREKLREGV